jgi:glutaredoxin
MSFWSFFTRRRRPVLRLRHDLHIVMYTRAGCHLCDDAWHILQQFRARYGFQLEAQDVDATPELVALHGDWVPVVCVNGQVRFRGRVNPVLLQRLLDAGA